jgi:protein subunit release factor A
MMDETPADEPFPIPETDEELLAQCRVDTFTSGGKGGQHQNRTESGVRLFHLPTGVVAGSREERSQHRNKGIALARLREQLEARNRRPTPRVPLKVPKREKEKRLLDKKKRSKVKGLRKRLEPDPEE